MIAYHSKRFCKLEHFKEAINQTDFIRESLLGDPFENEECNDYFFFEALHLTNKEIESKQLARR